MRIRNAVIWLAVAGLGAGTWGSAAEWSARQIGTFGGFAAPESVLPAGGAIYVSNVETDRGQYWGKDGKGFISLLAGSPPAVRELRWIDSGRTAKFNAPKGMCVFEGDLLVADIDTVWRLSTKGELVRVLRVQEAQRLNDLAADDKHVYASDTRRGRIFRLNLDGRSHVNHARLDAVNGITFAGGKMYAVTSSKADIYEIPDPSERRSSPVPFGLAGKFKALDGIEILPDGTFVVSDLEGNMVYTVSADRKTVTPLIKVRGPADIGLDRQSGTLFVPMLYSDTVAVYRLEKK